MDTTVLSASREERSSTPALVFMILLGMVLSGLIENTAFPKSSIVETASIIIDVGRDNNTNVTRRYCDAPNITVFQIYEMEYESEESSAEEYDFSQLEEMDFQMTLSLEDSSAQWRWELMLWGSLLGPIPASWLATKLGPGKLFGFCILASGVVAIFVPTADQITQAALLALQGILHSAILPCAILLGLVTISSDTRATYLVLLGGVKAGSGLGEIVPVHFLPFAACVLAITWTSAWVLMLKSPKLRQQKHPVPWKQLALSRVVWMSAAAVFGAELAQSAASYSLRQYLYLVYHYTNEFYLALPCGGHFIFAMICGQMAQVIETTKIVSRTTSRRIFVYISHFIPAGMLFIACFVGCDAIAPVALYAVGITCGGAAYCGAYASMLDVAPNFAAVIVAFVCTCRAVARLLPVILTSLVIDGLISGSWRMVLSMSALITLVTAMLFMLRGSSRPQTWNDPELQDTLRRPTLRRNMEEIILKVLMVQEREKHTRARACSTSHPHTKRIIHPKRASIS